jgi:hypothetical protein
MAIFNSYVSLPEGITIFSDFFHEILMNRHGFHGFHGSLRSPDPIPSCQKAAEAFAVATPWLVMPRPPAETPAPPVRAAA